MTIIIYLLNFIKYFPGVYLVEPPYDCKKMAEIISAKNSNVSIYSKNNENMFPPLQYYLLLQNFKKKIQISNDVDNLNYPDIFLINFFGKTVVVNDVDDMINYHKLIKIKKCKFKLSEFPFLFFASCIKR